MKLLKLSALLALFMTLTSCLVNSGDSAALDSPSCLTMSHKPLICAYMHIGNRKLDLKNINLSGVGILNLAFTKITNNRMGLIYSGDAENFMIARKLKKKYPGLKIFVSVGGYGTADVFSKTVMTDSTRKIFVDDAVRFVRYYGLDGIDVDWEFPGMKAKTREADKKNFTSLLKELRAAFDAASSSDSKKYYLTIAAGAFEQYLTYTEIQKIIPLTDYFFLMTYDFFGQWNDRTGHHTNLYPSSFQKSGYAVSRIVDSYIQSGVPARKIIIGAAFYGRKWTGVSDVNKGLAQKGRGVGSLSYSRIAALLKNKKYERYWDSQAFAPLIYNGEEKVFISYEDPQSVRRKADFVFMKKLGGLMYWEYFSDSGLSLAKAAESEFEINRGFYSGVKLPLGVNIKNVKN